MEINSSPSSQNLFRRNNYRRGSSINSPSKQKSIYKPGELKMLMMLTLINIYAEGKEKKLQNYEIQAQNKLNKTGIHFNRLSSTLTIEPTKKQILYLRQTSKQLQKIKNYIQVYFINYQKNSVLRKSINSTSTNLLSLGIQTNFSIIQSSKPIQKIGYSNFCQSMPKLKNLRFQQKQNVSPNLSPTKTRSNSITKQVELNRKILLQPPNFSTQTSPLKSAPIKRQKQKTAKQRRQKLFMLKKKQQIDFLRKITIQFNSQQAQYKALVQTIQLFFKNLTRANYYLKMIDQNSHKCQKIIIYILQLNRIFKIILDKLTKISKQNKSLSIKQPKTARKDKNSQKITSTTQFKHIPIEIQQYYAISYQLNHIIRQFLISPIFAHVMKPLRKQCSALIYLLLESRYTLRYLQKQIQNTEYMKKSYVSVANWQKAYRVKFLPKNLLG